MLFISFGHLTNSSGTIQRFTLQLFLVFHSCIAVAQGFGEIDTTFNVGTAERILSVDQYAQQKDGKIIVSGELAAQFTNGRTINLARLNYDGSFDPTFTYQLNEEAFQLGVDSEQRIYVATQSGFFRLLPNGDHDPSFKSEGTLVKKFVLQASGKIVIVDQRHPFFYISRLNSDGKIDLTFKEQKRYNVSALVLASDGEILAPSYNPTSTGYTFLRLKVDGEINSDFTSPVNHPLHVNHVYAAKNGMIYYVFGDAFENDERAARCFPNGEIDTVFVAPDEMTFGGAIDTSGNFFIHLKSGFYKLYDDGRIDSAFINRGTVSSQIEVDRNNRFLSKGWKLYRIQSNGENDPELKLVKDIIGPYRPILTPDDKLIIIKDGLDQNSLFSIVKLDYFGKEDPSFSPIKLFYPYLECEDGNGGFIVSVADTQNYERSIQHYFASGILDIGFQAPKYNYFNVNRLKSGKYLAEVKYDDEHYEVFRLNSDGTFDSTYTSLELFYPYYEMVENNIGNVYFQGDMHYTVENGKIIYKILPDGGVDPNYGDVWSFETAQLALQSDGKLLVGGMPITPAMYYMVMRYNVDGSEDSTFIPIFNSGLNDLLVDKYDKIIVAQTKSVSCYSSDGGTEPLMHDIVDREAFDVLQQVDGKILFFGPFCTYDLNPRRGSVRLYNSEYVGIGMNTTASSDWMAYPNPAKSTLTLSSNNSKGIVIFNVYNSTGNLIKSGSIMDTEKLHLGIEDWASGIYSIQFVQNDKTGMLKVVKD